MISTPTFIFNGTSTKKITSSVPAVQTLKDTYKDAFLIGTAVTPFITPGRDTTAQQLVKKIQ